MRIIRILGITICILVIASFSLAATDVSFTWDANTEHDLAGYKIYRSMTSGDYSSPVNVLDIPLSALADPTNPLYTENNIPDGEWFWVATAYDTYDNESTHSNEVTKVLDTISPNPPSNFSIWELIISWLKSLFGGFRIS